MNASAVLLGAILAVACGGSEVATARIGDGSGGSGAAISGKGGAGSGASGTSGVTGGSNGTGGGAVGLGGGGGGSGNAGGGGSSSTVITGGPPCTPTTAPTLAQVSQKELVYPSRGSAPAELRLADGALFFTESHSVRRMTPGQTSAEIVTDITGNSRTRGLHFNATHVFFTAETRVMRAPVSGSSVAAEVLLDGIQFGSEYILTVDETNVYLLDGTTAVIAAIPVSGGTRTTVASTARGTAGKVSDGYLYFVRPGPLGDEVVRIPVAGGAVERIAAAHLPNALEVDGNVLYVGDQDGVSRQSIGAVDSLELIMNHPPGTSSAIEGLSGADWRLGWGAGWSVFGWVSKDGTSCSAVVDVQTLFESAVIFGDDLYVTSFDGIYRIPL